MSKNERGFTLIELFIAIILLVGVGLVAYNMGHENGVEAQKAAQSQKKK